MKFLLVRHCETDWNRELRLQGHTDTSLNETGWMQAEELAQRLLDFNVKKIVSSDLLRSKETASVLSRYLNVPVLEDPRLRECSFGELEGKRREEISAVYKPRFVDLEEGTWHGSYMDYDFRKFGGEARDQVLGRQLSLLDNLYDEDSPEPTLLIGHGTSLNTLLTHLKKPHIQRGDIIDIEYPLNKKLAIKG